MGKVKKIVIVQDYAYISGGAANVAIESALGLKKAGYDVFYYSAVGPICGELKENDIITNCLGIGNINTGSRIQAGLSGIWNSKVYVDFYHYLYNFNVDDTIIHFHGWSKALSVSVIHAAQKRGFKIVITLHDYFSLCPNGGFYNYKKGCICKYAGMSINCVTCNCDKRKFVHKLWRVARQFVQDIFVKNNTDINYITISELNEKAVRGYTKSDKYYRVYNPVKISGKMFLDRTKSNKYIYVGRVSDEKGVELFCEACRVLMSRGENIFPVVVGDGTLLGSLKKEYPEIMFTGWLASTQVASIMKDARCLVFPSKWYEGAPLTIVEAMASGLPCIVSDCTSATELVVDGENGYVFEAGNLDSLIEKMEKSLDANSLNNMACHIRERFDPTIYSTSVHVDNLLRVYETVLQN